MESKDRDLQRHIDAAYHLPYGMAQHADEIVPFAEAVKRELQPAVILEIGTHRGGTARLWLGLASAGVYSIDLPMGLWGGIDEQQAVDRNGRLRCDALERQKNFAGYLGASDTFVADQFTRGITDMYGLLDLLFIDGDHSYEGVKADYRRYGKYVRPGGWIAFHDIIDTELHRNRGVEVCELWREIVAAQPERCREFIGRDGHWGGIGVVVV